MIDSKLPFRRIEHKISIKEGQEEKEGGIIDRGIRKKIKREGILWNTEDKKAVFNRN